MRRLWCRFFGHDNVWTLDPLRPTEHVAVCLTCRDRAWSYQPSRPGTSTGIPGIDPMDADTNGLGEDPDA